MRGSRGPRNFGAASASAGMHLQAHISCIPGWKIDPRTIWITSYPSTLNTCTRQMREPSIDEVDQPSCADRAWHHWRQHAAASVKQKGQLRRAALLSFGCMTRRAWAGWRQHMAAQRRAAAAEALAKVCNKHAQ